MVLLRLVWILESRYIYIFVIGLFNISKQYIPKKTRKSCARMFCPLPQSFRCEVASRCVTRANLENDVKGINTDIIICDGDNSMWFCVSLAQPLLQRHRQDFLSCKMGSKQARNHNLDVPPRLTQNTCTNRSFKRDHDLNMSLSSSIILINVKQLLTNQPPSQLTLVRQDSLAKTQGSSLWSLTRVGTSHNS